MSLQDLIVAFVNSQKPFWQFQHDLYWNTLYSGLDVTSALLTMLGYPPVP